MITNSSDILKNRYEFLVDSKISKEMRAEYDKMENGEDLPEDIA